MAIISRKRTAPPKPEPKLSNNLSELLSDLISKSTTEQTTKEVDERSNPFHWVDIIEFCESPYYLNLNLYPWQQLILKIFYMGSDGNRHLDINCSEDKTNCKNCVWYKHHQKLRQQNRMQKYSRCLYCENHNLIERAKDWQKIEDSMMLRPDEIEHLKSEKIENKFQNEAMIMEADLHPDSDSITGGSVKDQTLRKLNKEFSELLLVLGRRSGKSLLVSIIALYESYKLIEMKNPQAVFGNLNEGDTITILNVAVSEQQAKESVFDKIKPLIINSPYFKTKISPGSLQNRSVRFLTPRDEEINAQLIDEGIPAREGSIYLLSGHSNSVSLVGKSIAVVIIDEMASMVGKDGSKMSDEELYTKLKHSVWTFGSKGKIICISNPLTKDGKFFELYEQSFSDDRILMIQLPSYKVNPSLDQKALDAEREAARLAGQYEQYQMQIEARFSGGAADPFLPSDFIDEAFKKGASRRKVERGNPNLQYYMHLDPANNSDNYALVIVHVEEDPSQLDSDRKPIKKVIVDHIHMWQPSETGEPVEISEVDQYVIRLCTKFPIVSITYDMWESASSSQLLQRMGLPARIKSFNSNYKQQIYSTLRNLFFEGRIEFYMIDGYNPESQVDSYGFVKEAQDQFKFLERKFNRKSFSVAASAGHYDDIPDCVAGAAYEALTGSHGYVILPTSRTVRMNNFR